MTRNTVFRVALAAAIGGLAPLRVESQRVPDTPGPTSGHQMTYDTRAHRVLLYAGQQQDSGRKSYRSHLWSWDGTTWRSVATDGPPGRTDGLLAFDQRRGVLVLFGGRRFGARREDMTLLRDTWEWDAHTWRLVDSIGPGARLHAGMAYDRARRVMVLFGGFHAGEDSLLNDTWEWNGAHWSRRSDGPARRWVNALVATTDGVLLHAALRDSYDRASSTAAGELWRWTGAAWMRTDSSVRVDPQAPVAGTGKGFLFYFGWKRNAPAECWTWDGSSWTAVQGALPPRRRNTAMTFDPVRRRAVLYGGETDRDTFGDLWEFDGTVWQKRM